ASVVLLPAFGGLPSLGHEIVEQMRRDPDDLVLLDAVIDEFVVKAFRDEFQHPIALLLAGDFFIALLVHRCHQPHYFSFATKVQTPEKPKTILIEREEVRFERGEIHRGLREKTTIKE